MRRKGFAVYHRDFKWYAALASFTFGTTVFEAIPCVYCGMPANSDDHVVPLAFYQAAMDCVAMEHWRFTLVPSCQECNATAGDRVFETITQKRRYIQERLKCRYKKILAIPEWTEDEINDLSPDLARYVRHGLKLKTIIWQRITYRARPVKRAESLFYQHALGNGIAQSVVDQCTTPRGLSTHSECFEGDGI